MYVPQLPYPGLGLEPVVIQISFAISFASRSDLVRFHPLLPYLCALRLHGGRPPSATPDSNLYLMRLFFHWRQIPMVTYGDVGKQTSLSNQRNTYIHIAFTMGFAILRLLYPYMHKSCVHMVFRFENTTFQHFFYMRRFDGVTFSRNGITMISQN